MSLLLLRRRTTLALSALLLSCGFQSSRAQAQTTPLTLQGNLIYRERILLPAARAEVRLLDVSTISKAPAVISTDSMDINQQVPVPFHLSINRNLFKPGHTYALSAVIFVDGQPWFKTPSPAPVSLKTSKDITIILRREVTQPLPHTLKGSWHTDKIGQTSLRDGTITPTLDLHGDGTVSGSTVCNTIKGRYTATGQTIAFSAVASTKMACADSTVTQRERAFLHSLETVKNWEISSQGEILTLSNQAKEPLLVFHRQSHLPLK
ncbi:META domain-containing protein [Acetobacter thailandicus]|uniref:META domain-containing protein n=1 Tax=Acetobacter thailandicus TaxID=1502842 RepID=UPI001BAD0C04|nr:META domain-containing protein [Acetobacter thailandicus]MBS0986290.1 META domain-containing protein [Acetobacter thailandicus]